MRNKIIAGNWKMNGQSEELALLLNELALFPIPSIVNCIVFPPAIYLPLVQEKLSTSSIQWGGQNIYPAISGAYTGEISCSMLNDFGGRYVLVGHSERRNLFKEDEKFIADKFHHVKEHDMIPVLCIGETLDERENGHTKATLARQLSFAKGDVFNGAIIAYEPVWAIGTGKTAEPEQVQATHLMIRELIADISSSDANKVSVVYGGSVNEKNARALFEMPDVDGGLIGGASLNARQFVEIIKCIN